MTTSTRRDRNNAVSARPSREAAMSPVPRDSAGAAASSGGSPSTTPETEGAVGSGARAPASIAEVQARCAQLEDENRRLKLLVADLSLRNEALKLVVAKKW